jgi:hypothetical protein
MSPPSRPLYHHWLNRATGCLAVQSPVYLTSDYVQPPRELGRRHLHELLSGGWIHWAGFGASGPVNGFQQSVLERFLVPANRAGGGYGAVDATVEPAHDVGCLTSNAGLTPGCLTRGADPFVTRCVANPPCILDWLLPCVEEPEFIPPSTEVFGIRSALLRQINPVTTVCRA